ncbi:MULTISPECIES: hypothetical protein [Streptomyces violaceusniger group]|uniref:Antitoxin n=2 Tax=Streptomyces rhizosphaericus TaxID=114699 RepID=A0ABP4D774_9ACTN|nr:MULTISPECIES: hypothetical protein [Streptomyces violaceusniger group]
MVALQIRDVPDEVRDILAERARQLGQSLQGYLLDLVKHEAERAGNVALLQRFEGRSDGVETAVSETVRELDADRAARVAGPGLSPGEPGAPA